MNKTILVSLLLFSIPPKACANCVSDLANGIACPELHQQLQGNSGTNGTNGINGKNGSDGQGGKDGLNGKDATNPVLSAFLGLDTRVYDSEYWGLSFYYDKGLLDKSNVIGSRINIHLSKSYEEKLIEQLRKDIKDANLKLERIK